MENRKVQCVGGSTFIVSLPKSWIEKTGIQKGDSVSLHVQSDGRLLLDPKSDMKLLRKKVLILKDEDCESLLRKLIGVYIAGYSIIQIEAKKQITPYKRQTIREFTRKVIGLEIVEESINTVTIQELIDPGGLSLSKTIKRMYLIVKSMHQDAILALREKNGELAKDVAERDDEIDRLYWLVCKQYNMIIKDMRFAEKIGMSCESALNFLTIARIIERIGDHAAKMAKSIMLIVKRDIDREILNRITKTSESAVKILDMSVDAFLTKNLSEADAAFKLIKTLDKNTDELLSLISRLKGKDAVALAYVIESIRRTHFYAINISETAINYIMA